MNLYKDNREGVNMKKILIALLILIMAAVAYYYAFPERVAKYMLDLARKCLLSLGAWLIFI